MKTTARIIDDGAHRAAFNMAADLYLLDICKHSPAVTVRLYSWEGPSITLGISEKPEETLDEEVVTARGAQWIRRPTGGRSVLHDGDITYSCMFSAGVAGMGSTLSQTYGTISGCLSAGLECAGICCSPHDAAPDPHLSRTSARLPCFLSPNRHEIMAGGRKLVGSAQKRTAAAVLQHGSLPITGGFRNLPDFLRIDAQTRETQKSLLLQKCACVRELLPGIREADLRECMIQGFENSLAFAFVRVPWTKEELRDIEAMAESADFLRTWQGAPPARA